MGRNIRISKIGDFCAEEVQQVVKRTTIALHSKLQTLEALTNNGVGTPVVTARLIESWQLTFDSPYEGRVFNNTVYAAPVIEGRNLPPSWDGQHRTKQGTIKRYPDLIAKEVSRKDVPAIINAIRRSRR